MKGLSANQNAEEAGLKASEGGDVMFSSERAMYSRASTLNASYEIVILHFKKQNNALKNMQSN